MNQVEDLQVFKIAHELTLSLYNVTKTFPSEERYAVASQIRRASASIGANLMEGAHRSSTNEYKHFVSISRASAGELKYHLLLVRDLGYISQESYELLIEQVNKVSKMLYGLINTLESKNAK